MATHSSQPLSRPPTAEDLAYVPTRAEQKFRTPKLTFPDGTYMELTLRARDARARAACDRAARKAGAQLGIESDDETWGIECAFQGIAHPKLEESQKDILWAWNPTIIDEICDAIILLEELPARTVEAALARLAGIAVPEPPDPKAAGGRRRRRQPVADSPGASPEPAGQ